MKLINHPQYEEYSKIWTMIRDVLEGDRRIKSKGEKYLPKLPDQTDDEYKNWKDRAIFINYTYRVYKALYGMLFRKNPVYMGPENREEFNNFIMTNITLDGDGLIDVSRELVQEILTTGRIGLLVDFVEGREEPYLSIYTAENIINWKFDGKLQYVLLKEFVEEDTEELFEKKLKDIYRLLILEDGIYKQYILNHNKEKGNLEFLEEIEFIANNENIDFIPFLIINSEDLDYDVSKPPLEDVAVINLSHYKNSADIEKAIFYQGNPLLTIIGLKEDKDSEEEFSVGSSRAYIFEDENVKVDYVEYSGSGLDFNRKIIEDKEIAISKIGSRIISPEKKQTETADSARIRQLGESSVLSSISLNMSEGINKILDIIRLFMNIEEDANFKLNKDFDVSILSPQMLNQLITAFEKQIISSKDLHEIIQNAELRRSDKTLEQLEEELREDLRIREQRFQELNDN